MVATTAAAPKNLPAVQGAPNEVAIAEVERVAKEYALVTLEGLGHFQRALKIADGMRQLRLSIQPFMNDLMPLQNSNLGFLTDQREKGYSAPVIMEVVIEALLKGFLPFNNEFNIIAGRFYPAKNGYKRLLKQLPGFSDLKMPPPKLEGAAITGSCKVRVFATWRYKGKADQLVDEAGKLGCEFTVRVNAGMGVDAIIGKAEKKALEMIYEDLTGWEHEEADTDEALLERDAQRANGAAAAGLPMPAAARMTAAPPATSATALPLTITREQATMLNVTIQHHGVTRTEIQRIQEDLRKRYHITRLSELPAVQYEDAVEWAKKQAPGFPAEVPAQASPQPEAPPATDEHGEVVETNEVPPVSAAELEADDKFNDIRTLLMAAKSEKEFYHAGGELTKHKGILGEMKAEFLLGLYHDRWATTFPSKKK